MSTLVFFFSTCSALYFCCSAYLLSLSRVFADAYAGRGVLKLPLGRGQAKIEALRARLSTGQAAGGVTFVSALTGLPSFYAISVIAGTLGWPLSRFLAWGTTGRILRFSALLFLPGIVKGIL